MHKLLFDEFYLPRELKAATYAEKYRYLNSKKQHSYILQNNIDVFGPFPASDVQWDISEAAKIAIYNPEVTSVLTWIKTNIIFELGIIDYRTLGVLIRIATGMLNKCDISQELKIMYHDNMAWNLRNAHNDIVLSDLPF